VKTFRPYNPGQAFLLPPSPQDWLPPDHLARYLLDLVGEVDLDAIFRHYERELRGYPPYHPRMMTTLLLYAYCVGVPSSRKIERRCHEDVAFRVISGNQQPDHTAISEFRRVHLTALAGLFAQVLRVCQRQGLVKLGHVSLDGTKMKANASKHKAMSYKRMQDEDAKLRAKVDALLQEAAAVDAEEDARYGKDKRGDELPAEVARAEGRRERIRAALQALEAEAQAQAAAERAAAAAGTAPPEANADGDDDDHPPPAGPTPLPSHQIPRGGDGKPTPKAQRNFTDPESRIMKTGDGYLQGYNCQAVVDSAHQVIVALDLSNQPPDCEYLVPMLERTVANCGATPRVVTGDAGYYSEANTKWLVAHGMDPYLATRRQKRNEAPPPVRGRPPAGLTARQLMTRKLLTKRGAAIYARRKTIPEPVFGQIKNRGLRGFLLRGLAKARGEWALMGLSHNLLKLHGVWAAA
jgi:transposase